MKVFYSTRGIVSPFKEDYRVENSSSYDLLTRRARTHYDAGCLYPCLYRPFDYQWIYYQPGLTSRPAWDVMQHMLHGRNLSLILTRQTKFEFSCLCAETLSDKACANSLDINTVIPLYLYHTIEDNSKQFSLLNEADNRDVNYTRDFISAIGNKLNRKFTSDAIKDSQDAFSPEDLFAYIYAILNSPAYRARYDEFLRIDFPRFPITGNLELFRELCGLGKNLVALHLLEHSVLEKPITKLKGRSRTVAAGYPKCEAGSVFIDPVTRFDGVPQDVWEFQVGGYQVCHKWLKDRRGRELSEEDIVHYQKIVVALNETIRLMKEIDKAIDEHGGWPIK